MSSLLVICPSHRRPNEALSLCRSFEKTKNLSSTSLAFLVWEEDPDLRAYSKDMMVVACPEEQMAPRCNGAQGMFEGYSAVGWVADDNRFNTPGWDEIVLHALRKSPIVFGNDVESPGSKPSHVFMDARIPQALGWFLQPDLIGTFHDDAWMHLGTGAPTQRPLGKNGETGKGGLGIRYIPEVVLSHLYTERDNSENFHHDMPLYESWVRHRAEDDIAKCRRALRK